MSKINLTNRQARIIAESIFKEITDSIDLKLEKRKEKELKQFIATLKKDPVYVKLVKAEEELEKAVIHSKVIRDAHPLLTSKLPKKVSLGYNLTYIWGTDLGTDNNTKLSQLYIDKQVAENFKAHYGVTVDELESKVVLSIIGKDNIDSLIKEIKAEYIK